MSDHLYTYKCEIRVSLTHQFISHFPLSWKAKIWHRCCLWITKKNLCCETEVLYEDGKTATYNIQIRA